MTADEVAEVATPSGPARVHLHHGGRGLLVLGHGAGGGIVAPDLQAAARAALEAGLSVALVEQPYRVAGRRAPAPAARLDEAWEAVVATLREHATLRKGSDPVCQRGGTPGRAPLVVGGRSSGARVACRTAAVCGADGVVCLAFPVHPPGRPKQARLPELDAVAVPVLVVQGAKDPFGMPPERDGRTLVVLEGDHGLRREHARLREAVGAFVAQFV